MNDAVYLYVASPRTELDGFYVLASHDETYNDGQC